MDIDLSCDEIKQLLSAYFDEELLADQTEIVTRHLNLCQSCARELENIKKLSILLKDFSKKKENIDFSISEKVINRINNEDKLTCNEVLEELSAYFDGEISLKLHYLVAEHLISCADCQTAYNKIEKLSSLLKSSFSMNKNPDLSAKLEINLNNIDICNEINENLSAYLDKELSKEETVKISEHLLSCKYCRRDYENLKYTQFMVKSYLEEPVSQVYSSNHDICERALQKLDKIKRKKEMFASIAAILIMTVLSWFSVNTVEPVIMQKAYGYSPKLMDKMINPDRPVFVKAEKFLFTQAYSTPSEGVISVLYEDS